MAGAFQMAVTNVERVIGRRVWDSRGRPTVEAEVLLCGGARGRAIAPAGASIGSGEAKELRDGGTCLGGQDVQNAVSKVNGEINHALRGLNAADQIAIDRQLIDLDGTKQKARLGGNAIIAVSMAAAHASAAASQLPLYAYLANDRSVSLPLPKVQIFGGGAHAGRRVDIQDFLVMCPSAKSFSEALNRTGEVYQAAGRLMLDDNRVNGVADEGGWWPAFGANEEALDFLMRAIECAGFTPGQDVYIALDVAASEFASDGLYKLALEDRKLDRDALAELLFDWIDRYPILSIEDPFSEHDIEGFSKFTAAVGRRVQIVGDDLLVTNAQRVCNAASNGLVSCALIKPNQAGTLSETKAAFDAARSANLSTIISARSGETEDTTIAHLAVGWDAGQIKVGSMARGERTAKWNELLRLEQGFADQVAFAGWNALPVRWNG
jgi:enolase